MGKFHILVKDDPPSGQLRKLIEALQKRFILQPVIIDKTDLKNLSLFQQTRFIVISSYQATKGYELIKALRLSNTQPLTPIILLTRSGCAPARLRSIRFEPDAYTRWPAQISTTIDLIENVVEGLEHSVAYEGLRKKFVFHVQNELRFLFRVNNIITNQFIQLGLEDDEIVNLRLTLDELGTNAIRHGNRNEPDKMVTIRCLIYQDHIFISIEDQGPGFEVSDIPDPTNRERILLPSGRGIFIARQLMDNVQYNETGNRVEFVKDLSSKSEKTTSAHSDQTW
ncbi:ATP-binding protein [bacterium]|nr:ATP-binding protein [bacterium]